MSLLGGIRRALLVRALNPVARGVVDDRLTYLRPEKLHRIQRAIRETRDVPGDILEFGVALGGSAIILATHAGERRFIGFDVFGMIPPPTSEKDDSKSRERYAAIKSGQSEGIGGDEYYGYRPDLLSDVKAAFARHGIPVDGTRVILHKGLFEASWPAAGITQVSLAHIDCDWYDPVKFCLNACADILSPGGMFVIDDYNDYGGCRTAVDEFLAERADFVIEAGHNPYLRKVAGKTGASP